MQKSSARCPQGNLAGRMLQVFPKTGDSSTDQFMLSLSQQGKPAASTTDKKIVRASNSSEVMCQRQEVLLNSATQPPQPPVINTDQHRTSPVASGGIRWHPVAWWHPLGSKPHLAASQAPAWGSRLPWPSPAVRLLHEPRRCRIDHGLATKSKTCVPNV